MIVKIINFLGTNNIVLGIASFCTIIGFVFMIMLLFRIEKIKTILTNNQSINIKQRKTIKLKFFKECKKIIEGAKMKFNQKKRRLVGEIIGIISAFAVFIISFMVDISIFNIPEIFVLKIENYEELFFNLFAVQAATASIGIAIIALLSGVNTESVYGICFSKFIANDRPHILKHNVLIIFNLAITFINYFIVSYSLFNLSIAIFFISIIISIILVKETYIIFLGRKALKSQIKTYILDNYKSWGLDDIFSSLNDIQNLKNLSITRENLEIIEEIFDKEIAIASQGKDKNFLNQLEKTTTETLIHILRKNDSELIVIALGHLLKLYEIANNNKFPVVLNLWDSIIYEYFNAIKELSKTQLDDTGVFGKIHQQIYNNIQFKTIEDKVLPLNGADLRYYSSWVYSAITHSRSGDSFNLEDVAKRLYDNIVILSKIKNGVSENHKLILRDELCVFAKTLIDNCDVDTVGKLYFDNCSYGSMEEYEELSLLIVLVYLYYLACRESLVDDERKTAAQEIIKSNIVTIKNFFSRVNFVKATSNYLDYCRKLMKMWEIMPEKGAKTMVFDRVINDFFILATLEHCWSEDDLMHVLCEISPDSSFSLYSSYFSGENDEYVKELLTNFRRHLLDDEETKKIDGKIDMLRNVLYKKYKKDELAEGIEEEITPELESNFKRCIKETVESILLEHSHLLDDVDVISDDYKVEKLCVLSMTLPNLIINSETLYNGIYDDIKSAIIISLLRVFSENIILDSISYKERDIQEKFIQLVKVSNINGDTYIGNRDIFWTEDNKYLLKEFVTNMEKITTSFGYNQMYIIDSSAFCFNVSNITVEFENLSEEEIEGQCRKDEDGKLMYNVTNDIYIPFEKEELKEHLNRIIKKVKINATVAYKTTKNVIGAGIEISVDDE